MVIGGHKLKREVCQGDQAVGVHQLTGYLMPEIAASIGAVLAQACDLFGSFATAAIAFLTAGRAALCQTQLCQRPAQPARVGDHRAIRQRQQIVQSHVETHYDAGTFVRRRSGSSSTR